MGTARSEPAEQGASSTPTGTETFLDRHPCHPSRLADRPRAHLVRKGTEVTCPVCEATWRVTKRHHDARGRRGAICACGWERVA